MRYYLTTAIDYVNSRPHLGTAYEKITADVIARYHRLRGDDTWFLMGNDEHSQNVYRRATEAGKDPLVYCDEMAHVLFCIFQMPSLRFPVKSTIHHWKNVTIWTTYCQIAITM